MKQYWEARNDSIFHSETNDKKNPFFECYQEEWAKEKVGECEQWKRFQIFQEGSTFVLSYARHVLSTKWCQGCQSASQDLLSLSSGTWFYFEVLLYAVPHLYSKKNREFLNSQKDWANVNQEFYASLDTIIFWPRNCWCWVSRMRSFTDTLLSSMRCIREAFV